MKKFFVLLGLLLSGTKTLETSAVLKKIKKIDKQDFKLFSYLQRDFKTKYDDKPTCETNNFEVYLLNCNQPEDHSLIIKDIVETKGKIYLFSKGRDWCTALDLNMLEKFFGMEVNENGDPLSELERKNLKLFEGGEIELQNGETTVLQPLQISYHKDIMNQYQGNFAIISLNFATVLGSSVNETVSLIKKQLRSQYARHQYLKDFSTEDSYFTGYLYDEEGQWLADTDAIYYLSRLLFEKYNKKIIVIIDEYDTLINKAYKKFKGKKYFNIFHTFFYELVRDIFLNRYFEKLIIRTRYLKTRPIE